jgi:hypothetical protein
VKGDEYVEGRVDSRNKRVLEYLSPGEVRKFKIDVAILEGSSEIDRLKNEVSRF